MDLDGSDIVGDDYDQDQRSDVAIITPDDSTEEIEVPPLANDFEAMKLKVLPESPELEAESEAYSTWHIENWRNLPRKEHSPVFEIGGFPWRILFFPFGNNCEYASLYLEHGFEEVPEDWYACVQFTLVLWNKNDPTIYTSHTATHRFTAEDSDWGFTRFTEVRKLFAPWEGKDRPLVEGQEAMLTTYVRVMKDPTGVLWHNFTNYDSKKVTGMVGLKNQGATCYLNSLLQSLYFTNAFRKAVYQIPTDDEATKTNSAYTLQRLFYYLQTSDLSVSTQELTASFGWDSRQIFEQQDVQELSRVLMDKLEEKMKGTIAERALPDLFVGKSKTYISCINVDFESSRIEDYWDIQLNVRGSKTLHDSFMDYIQVETLEGENKYDAGEPYKLQDAKKGVIFESFPPVLHLQLKRFEYDMHRDAMMKVNDRHEFPEEFDAAPYLSDNADKSESWEYQLTGVLVHSGDFNAGHYYAFLRPHANGPFYKFDDDRVTRSTTKETFEDNFGGEYNYPNGAGVRQPYTAGYSTKKSMSAYMLVYVRKSRLDQVLFDITAADVPSHLERRLAEERAELALRKKEREEAHLYINVAVISDATIRHHHEFDLAVWDKPSLQDPSTPKIHRILRTTKVSEFADQISQEHGLEASQCRFWAMINRQNKTFRPDQPLIDTNMSMEEAAVKHGGKTVPFRLYAELGQAEEDGKQVWPESQTATSPYMIILKHFDIEAQAISGVGHTFVKRTAKIAELAPKILQIMGWPAGTQVLLFEEIKQSMIEPMKAKQTFLQSEIQDGDIICFQKVPTEAQLNDPALITDTRYHYDYLVNKTDIVFMPRYPKNEEGEEFKLTLSKKMTYEQFSAKVGEHLGVDPSHLRFATVSSQTLKPKQFIKRNAGHTLQQSLQMQYGYSYSNSRSDALFYEVLDASLSEYETKKLVKVTWLLDGITKEETHDILVPKNGIISDLIPGLQKKAKLDDETVSNLRFYEAHGGKVYKVLDDDFSVTQLNDYVIIYVEKIPEDEREVEEGDVLIDAFHFDKEPNKPHGVPFKFVMKQGEIFSKTKERISKRTGIKGKQLEKIKFAVVARAAYSKPRYLSDDDLLSDFITDPEDCLGLDHVNKSRSFWGKSDSIFIR